MVGEQTLEMAFFENIQEAIYIFKYLSYFATIVAFALSIAAIVLAVR